MKSKVLLLGATAGLLCAPGFSAVLMMIGNPSPNSSVGALVYGHYSITSKLFLTLAQPLLLKSEFLLMTRVLWASIFNILLGVLAGAIVSMVLSRRGSGVAAAG